MLIRDFQRFYISCLVWTTQALMIYQFALHHKCTCIASFQIPTQQKDLLPCYISTITKINNLFFRWEVHSPRETEAVHQKVASCMETIQPVRGGQYHCRLAQLGEKRKPFPLIV